MRRGGPKLHSSKIDFEPKSHIPQIPCHRFWNVTLAWIAVSFVGCENGTTIPTGVRSDKPSKRTPRHARMQKLSLKVGAKAMSTDPRLHTCSTVLLNAKNKNTLIRSFRTCSSHVFFHNSLRPTRRPTFLAEHVSNLAS